MYPILQEIPFRYIISTKANISHALVLEEKVLTQTTMLSRYRLIEWKHYFNGSCDRHTVPTGTHKVRRLVISAFVFTAWNAANAFLFNMENGTKFSFWRCEWRWTRRLIWQAYAPREYRWAQYVGHMTHWSNASTLLVCTGSAWWFVLALFLQHSWDVFTLVEII